MSEKSREIWLEKYRPHSLEDVKGQEEIVESLENYAAKGDMPNLLFAGPPGVGKTASAVAIAREIFGEDWSDNFLEMNASDERGIDVVRQDVKSFARASTTGAEFRIIFLDEADSLTSDAQAALRRTMEQFASNVRFILSCNYSSQIIEPLQSRCTIYRYTPLKDSAIKEQVREIVDNEGIDITESALDAIAYAADGDMRRAINGLNAVSILGGKVDEERVYSLTNTVQPEDVERILKNSMNGKFIQAREIAREVMNENGVATTELLDQIYRRVWESDDITSSEATEVTDLLSDADYRISQGANADIQLDGFLSKLSSV
jgi:replication factor C small subunit